MEYGVDPRQYGQLAQLASLGGPSLAGSYFPSPGVPMAFQSSQAWNWLLKMKWGRMPCAICVWLPWQPSLVSFPPSRQQCLSDSIQLFSCLTVSGHRDTGDKSSASIHAILAEIQRVQALGKVRPYLGYSREIFLVQFITHAFLLIFWRLNLVVSGDRRLVSKVIYNLTISWILTVSLLLGSFQEHSLYKCMALSLPQVVLFAEDLKSGLNQESLGGVGMLRQSSGLYLTQRSEWKITSDG